MILFTAGVTFAAGILFGLAPTFTVARIPIADALKTHAAASLRDPSRVSGGKFVMVLQIAMCLALSSVTGLVVHTLQKLESVDVGFQTSRLLVFGINPHATTAEDRLAFYRELMNRLRSVPLVESVTVSGNRIGSGWSNNTMAWVDGRLPPNSLTGTDRQIEWNNVGPKFFSTLGIRIIAGRDFADLDSPSSPAVAVVNETFAPRRR